MTVDMSIPVMNPDWLLVIITGIYSIATLVIVLENRKSNNLIRKEIREMHRPIVSVYFTVSKGLGVLRIKNAGDTIAKSLSLTCEGTLFEEDEYCVSKERSEKMLASEINIGPGEHFDLCLGLPVQLVSQKRPRVIKIEYHSDEESYYEETKITFSEYAWARLEPDPLKSMEKSLADINKSIEGLQKQ